MTKTQQTALVTVPAWALFLPVGAMLILMIALAQGPDGRLHVWVLDVGQGDAIFVKTPKGHTALIDGGPGATPLLNGIGGRVPFWQRDLDLVVLTHPHQDHLMGLVDVLARYRVDQIVQTELTATGVLQTEWLRAVEREGASVYYARRGDKIGFEGEPGITLEVLHPSGNEQRQDANANSIVLRLEYGKSSILLAGDATGQIEGEMALSAPTGLQADVLKVAHHGSGTSSTRRFVDLVDPKVAVISVGSANRFGHPAPQTIETLQASGARIYRTDRNSTVEIITDGENLWVRSER